jgi:NTP pyrophosphatase (non-canonical NTP hydrolase)
MHRLEDVVKEVKAFVADRDWGQFHDPKNLAMAVASEAGELLSEYRWVRNEEADSFSRRADNRKKIAAEAADVGISLLLLCDRIGIDLLQAIHEKLKLNRKNYPVELSRGQHDRPRKRKSGNSVINPSL